jgi:hypothetical protein
MAQQAKPNNMYHCEEARPQFSRSSTFVVKTVSGNWLINDVKTSFKDFRRSSRGEGAGAGTKSLPRQADNLGMDWLSAC